MSPQEFLRRAAVLYSVHMTVQRTTSVGLHDKCVVRCGVQPRETSGLSNGKPERPPDDHACRHLYLLYT